jgi:hypothetical protein
MPRRDWPDFSITEYILCGLFLGGTVVCLIVAGHAWANDATSDALEAAGMGLLLLGGSVDPVRHVVDMFTFLWRRTEPAGRDTRLTRTAAGLGLLLWLAGVAGNWLT